MAIATPKAEPVGRYVEYPLDSRKQEKRVQTKQVHDNGCKMLSDPTDVRETTITPVKTNRGVL